MRTQAMLFSILAAVSFGSTTYAQEPQPYRLIDAPPGPLVLRDRQLVAPPHDPRTERVAFRVSPVLLHQADVPFFVEREGRVVTRLFGRYQVYDWLIAGDVAILCDVPGEGGEVPSLNYKASWEGRCDIERLERDSP